jgi:hypothetical protein
MVWWTHVGDDPQTQEHPAQGGGKISSATAPNPSGVSIKGHHRRTTILLEKGDDCLHCSLGVKIFTRLCREQYGGSCIDEVANLYNMLPLAL